ncbi:hypothetical protein MRX96_033747 [Rhipicephalus microplus]
MSSEGCDAAEPSRNESKKTSRLLKHSLRALRSSDSDEEKLAALLVVTKVVDPSSVKLESLRELLDAIGVSYILRMLKSDTETFRTLGADATCAFAVEPSLCERLRPAVDAFAGSLADLGVAAGVECASRLVLHEPGCRALVNSGLLKALVGVSPAELGSLLAALAARLRSTESGETADDWESGLLSSARICVGQALSGRLGPGARRGLFALLASLVERRGVRSLDAPTVALAAVELEMQLCSWEQPDAELVVDCCLLLEVAVDDAVASGKLPPDRCRSRAGCPARFSGRGISVPILGSWTSCGVARLSSAVSLVGRRLYDDEARAVLGAETLDSFSSLLDFCAQKVVADTMHPVTLKANLALLGLFLLRSKLQRSMTAPDTLDLTAFVERCTWLFNSSPTLPQNDVEEWNELSSLGKQVLRDVLSALTKPT